MSRSKRVVIFGGGGFIGSSIAIYLSQNPETHVVIFDRSFPPFIQQNSAIQKTVGDFTNPGDIRAVLRAGDTVVHAISLTVPATSAKSPSLEAANFQYTLALFEACAEVGVAHIVYTSTGGAMYGSSDTQATFAEESTPRPMNPYGITKLALEQMLAYYGAKYHMRYTVLRYSNCYGYDHKEKTQQGIIPILIQKILRKEKISVYGNAFKDYIYIDDLAEITSRLITTEQDPASGVYHVSSGVGSYTHDIVRTICQTMGHDFGAVEQLPAASHDPQHIVLANTAIQAIMPDLEFTPIDRGIRQTIQKYKQAIIA